MQLVLPAAHGQILHNACTLLSFCGSVWLVLIYVTHIPHVCFSSYVVNHTPVAKTRGIWVDRPVVFLVQQKHELVIFLTWINLNHIGANNGQPLSSPKWNYQITYLSASLNGKTVEVWGWVSIFPHFTRHVHAEIKLVHAYKRGPMLSCNISWDIWTFFISSSCWTRCPSIQWRSSCFDCFANYTNAPQNVDISTTNKDIFVRLFPWSLIVSSNYKWLTGEYE